MIKIETIRLGGSSLFITRLGMGCWAAGGHGWGSSNDAHSIAAIRHAFDEGCTFFDTADVYGLGHSEELIRRALGKHRHDVVIASKGGVRWNESGRIWKDCSPAHLRKAVDRSLLRLGIDTIPLYYVHWPDGTTPIAAAVEELDRLRELKRISALGISNFTATQVKEAVKTAKIDALQFKFNLLYRDGSDELLSLCHEHGITPIFHGVLADGLLTGKFTRESAFGPDDHRSRMPEFQGSTFLNNLAIVDELRSRAKRIGASPGQVALRWPLDSTNNSAALFGAKTIRQVADNLAAACMNLPDDFMAYLTCLASDSSSGDEN